jgi:hypothetical protein
MKLKHYLSIFVIAAAVGYGCAGATGPAGPSGPSGYNGVANINTQQYTVTSWANPAVDTWTATFVESDITDYNNDAVLAYWDNGGSGGWIALPFSNININGDQFSFGYTNGSITFTYYGNANPPNDYTNTLTVYFKVTVIPPAIQVKYPKVNWKNAAEALTVPEVQAALAKK